MSNDAYTKLMNKLGSEGFPLVREILKRLANPEEAEMLLSLPATAREIAAKYGLDKQAAETKLNTFVRKGLCVSFPKGGEIRYFFARSMGQISDATAAAAYNRTYEPVPADLLKLWSDHRETEMVEWAEKQQEPRAERFRVIPLRAAFKGKIELLPFEDTEAIVRGASSIAVVNCPCRMYRVTEGFCDNPLEVCLQLTEGSTKYALDQGIGRQLSLAEGLQVLRVAEEAGLVPTTYGREKIGFICHCDGDCCGNISLVAKTGFPMVEKSRFQASLDRGLCNGCQICVERCNFGAIEMRAQTGTKRLLAQIEPEKCYGCGACVIKCPTEALSLDCVRPPEHIPVNKTGHSQV